MASIVKHTPLPWHLERQNDYSPLTVIATKHVDIVDCSYQSDSQEQDEANAAFILLACGAHGELVKALKYARRFLNSTDHDTAFVDRAIALAEAGNA